MLVGANNFLVPNLTFVIELVAFLGVVAFLSKYVLPLVNNAVNKRQETLRQALVDAREAKERAEQAEAEYQRVIDQARAESRRLVDEANRLAEQLRNEKQAQADREYDLRVSRAAADINAEARRAAEELRNQIADLVITVVEKVIGEGLSVEVHRALIDRTIAEVEAQAQAPAGVDA
jgi:F-type H+-transporting ATPase subunit b